jgi:hypothetical protein
MLFTSAALAQGADDCASAQAIAGPGTYNFDNSAATMDGVPDILCDSFGTQDIDLDVWFAYTAASTATVTVDTCNGAGAVDTKIAAYDGACGGAILACNDDTCGLQSSISFPATAGNVYILRVGSFPGAAGGADVLTIAEGGGGGGGGNDDCANATAISGPGTYNFDNSAATMDGVADPMCDEYGTQDIDLDVWFAYTAASTATVTVDTCTGFVDTKLAAYDGSCGGAILDCNDDTCGLQSTISFPATAGNVYMLRVGSFPGAAGGADVFNVTEGGGGGGGPQNDDCANAEVIAGQGSFNYDNTSATTDGSGDILCDAFGTQDIENDVWYEWTADDNGTATVETCNGAGGDTKIAAYDAGCGSTMLACNDDTCGLASQIMFPVTNGTVYLLRIGSFPGAAGGAGFFDISIDGGGGGCVDSVYCSSLPNSTGATASINWSGSCIVADNNFTLDMGGGPANQPGLFIYGANQASIPFGNGVLCISAPILRLNPPVFMDGAGTASKVVDLANPPSQTGLITAGSQWNFAMWLRDPAAGAAGYTFTDGLSVDFQ